MPHPPTIAIVGRANVGKSTLFNKLLEEERALVSDIAGTTRDRQEGLCVWRGQVVRFFDTGGVDIKHPNDIEAEILRQTRLAVKESDVILFLLDAGTGPLPFDRSFYKELCEAGKPLILAGNKADTRYAKALHKDAWSWAGGVPQMISASRGTGIGDLLDELYEALERIGKPAVDVVDVRPTRVLVLGQPNVGKSSLLNALLNEERFITSAVAHTTRGPNDVVIEHGERTYIFIDTAGIRRSANTKGSALEKVGVRFTETAMARSDVVLYVLDASADFSAQDRVLAGDIGSSKAGVVVIINKWDLIENKETGSTKAVEDFLRQELPSISHAPMLFVSAKTHQRVEKIYEMVDTVAKRRFFQITQEELDVFLAKAMKKHRPAKGMGTAPPKIMGMRQLGTHPPTFELVIKSRHRKKLHPSYVRFLENQLRETFDLAGSPVRIYVAAITSTA